MDIATLLEKFGLQITLIIILLTTIGVIMRLLWVYFTNKEIQLQAKLDAKEKIANENQIKFLDAYQQVARTLELLQKNQEEHLRSINLIIDLIQEKRRTRK